MIQSDVNEVKKFIDEKMEEFKLSIDGYLSSIQKCSINFASKENNDQFSKRVNAILVISRWAVNNKVDIQFDQALGLIDALSKEIEELRR